MMMMVRVWRDDLVFKKKKKKKKKVLR